MTTADKQGQPTWRRYPFAGVVLICLILYTLLGFFFAPWLADRIATQKVREILGAELRIDEIAINPFTFVVNIEGIEFEHPPGELVATVGKVGANLEATALFGKTVKLAELSVNRPELFLRRDGAGELNVARIRPITETPATPPPETTGDDWLFVIEAIGIDDMSLRLTDETVDPAASLGFDDLALNIRDFSTAPNSPFPVDVSLSLLTGGSISASGNAALLPQPDVTLAVTLNDVSPELLHPYVAPLADVTFDSGGFYFEGDIASDADDVLGLTGEARVDDLLLTETEGGARLGSWDRVAVNGIDFSIEARALSISEIVVDAVYADILISENGSINLRRAGKGAEVLEKEEELPEPEDVAPPTTTAPAFDVTVGRIVIKDAAAAFEDRALPLPFAARIHELNGQLSTIATSSTAPSEISLEGRVDEFGQVLVSGSLAPLDPKKDTRVSVNFVNVETPKLSAYTIRFAGREITSGKLDLKLDYEVSNSQLVAGNNIVLRDFELGDEVPHPDATSLPLDLALALLKDSSGNIDIDIPLSGDIDDPEFSIAGVVGTAFGNLVTGVVAAPFKLLGNLLGIEADELEALHFVPGRADLSPPQQEIAGKLAEALVQRPQLVLEFGGVWHEDADGLALREQAVDARIEEQISHDSSVSYADRRIAVIESLYTSQPGQAPLSTDVEIDRIARAANLRTQLIQAEPLADSALPELADARAANARAAILEADATLQVRILTRPSQRSREFDGDSVAMKIELSSQR